jgi:thiamine-phosphate pyrophosphorylase
MFEIIAVTDRRLCRGDFMERVEALAASGVSAVMLREKDLPPDDYEELARRVIAVCARHSTPFIAHGFPWAARRAGCDRIQLPLPAFMEARGAGALDAEEWRAGVGRTDGRSGALPDGCVLCAGVSVHSPEEARRAADAGAVHVVAGHIFATDSKPGLAPRGTGFLSAVCSSVSIPVYAIGGISEENIGHIKKAGAAGACLMSAFMRMPLAELPAYVERLSNLSCNSSLGSV